MQELTTIDEDGVIVETTSFAVQLQKAEIDQLVSTARAYPRSLKRVQSNILSMATLDEDSAEESIYSLPRDGKKVVGPSIRFAEILKQAYGNCQAAARVVHVDRVEKFVEAEGVFIDFETNARTTSRVRRRISGKSGRIYSDDMIIVTGNAACAIAMRNAILGGVPKPLWRNAFDQVMQTIAGDVKTLGERRAAAMTQFAGVGLKPEQVCAAIGRASVEDITVDDMIALRGMWSALKNGEATVDEIVGGPSQAPASMAERYNKQESGEAPSKEAPVGGGAAVAAEAAPPADEVPALADMFNEKPAEPEPAAGEEAAAPTPAAASTPELTPEEDEALRMYWGTMSIALAAAGEPAEIQKAVKKASDMFKLEGFKDCRPHAIDIAAAMFKATIRASKGEISIEEAMAPFGFVVGAE